MRIKETRLSPYLCFFPGVLLDASSAYINKKSESSGAFLFLFNICSVFRANQYGTERNGKSALNGICPQAQRKLYPKTSQRVLFVEFIAKRKMWTLSHLVVYVGVRGTDSMGPRW